LNSGTSSTPPRAAAVPASIPVRVAHAEPQTDEVCGYVLHRLDGQALPRAQAGAHIDVHLPGGLVRPYSLCGDPARTQEAYHIAVKREAGGRGGSRAVHEALRAGSVLHISPPRNLFALAPRASHHLLLGGGIGLTPLVAMAHTLHQQGASFTLAAYARSLAHLPLRAQLASAPWRECVQVHLDHTPDFVPAAELVARAAAQAHVYFCGPAGFMDSVRQACAAWPAERVHFEYFSAPAQPAPADAPAGFELVLARRQRRLAVPAATSIAQVLHDAGIHVDTVCEQGICGSCITPYLAGEPDHQDACLSQAERATHLAVCCSRSHSPSLTLDL
jgi:vanillate O-demethylase ferredoxin subunit